MFQWFLFLYLTSSDSHSRGRSFVASIWYEWYAVEQIRRKKWFRGEGNLLRLTHPYRAIWPRGLSAGSGRPCTTRAGPASSRGSKSSWETNKYDYASHDHFDSGRFAFAASDFRECILRARLDPHAVNFIYLSLEKSLRNKAASWDTGHRKKRDFPSSMHIWKRRKEWSDSRLYFSCGLALIRSSSSSNFHRDPDSCLCFIFAARRFTLY